MTDQMFLPSGSVRTHRAQKPRLGVDAFEIHMPIIMFLLFIRLPAELTGKIRNHLPRFRFPGVVQIRLFRDFRLGDLRLLRFLLLRLGRFVVIHAVPEIRIQKTLQPADVGVLVVDLKQSGQTGGL